MAYKPGRYSRYYNQLLAAKKRDKEADEATAGVFERPLLGKKNMDIINTGLAVRGAVQGFRDNAISNKMDETGYYMDADGTVTEEKMFKRNKGGTSDWLFGWEKSPELVMDKMSDDGTISKNLMVDTEGNPLTKDQYKEYLRFKGGQSGAIDPTTGITAEDEKIRTKWAEKYNDKDMGMYDALKLEKTDGYDFKANIPSFEEVMGFNADREHPNNVAKEEKDSEIEEAIKEVKSIEDDVDFEKLSETMGFDPVSGESIPQSTDATKKVDKLITGEQKDLYGFPDDILSQADKLEWLSNNKPDLIDQFLQETPDKGIQVDGGIPHPFPIPDEEMAKIKQRAKDTMMSEQLADEDAAKLEENLVLQHGDWVDSRTGEIIYQGEAEQIQDFPAPPTPNEKAQEEIEGLMRESVEGGDAGKITDRISKTIADTQEAKDIKFLTGEVLDREVDILESEAKMTAANRIDEEAIDRAFKERNDALEARDYNWRDQIIMNDVDRILSSDSPNAKYGVLNVVNYLDQENREIKIDSALRNVDWKRSSLPARTDSSQYKNFQFGHDTLQSRHPQHDTKLFKKALGQLRNLFGN
jgi:hypothetical protein